MLGHVLLNHKRQCSTNVTRQLMEPTSDMWDPLNKLTDKAE